jgi:heat shock protein HslJ
MRKLTLIAFALAVTAIITACSSSTSSSAASGGSGSDLTGKTWQLTAITEKVPAFQGVVPTADQANYTIEFKSDGTFQAKADCNQVSGTYTTTSSGGLTIVLGPSTLVACPEGSLGSQYVTGLGNAASYAIANGQLTITLKDEGTLVFKSA